MKGRAALALFLLTVQPASADDAVMAAANGFYSVSVTARPNSGGGIPGSADRARFQMLLSPRLNKALADAAAAELRFNAKNKNSPPLIEGDIFSSLFEGPTAWRVNACQGDAGIQRCTISLTRQDAGQKPVAWTDTLVLANNGGWKVDDIAYDANANFAFGNTGTLSAMLKMVVREAP